MYIEEFDNLKTKILKYIMYKKRTEREIRQKFSSFDENMVEDAIEYLKEAGYIDDYKYVERAINEFVNINTLSIKEIKYKLMKKGISKDIIEDYLYNNSEMLENYEVKCAKKIYQKKSVTDDRIEIINFLRKKGYTEDSIKQIEE